MKIIKDRVEKSLKKSENYLLSLKGSDLWGESSSSPYSTAWALLAFLYSNSPRAKKAAQWLLNHQNRDGSWGSSFRYHERLIFTPYCLTSLLLYEKKKGTLPGLTSAVRKARQFIQFSMNILENLNSMIEMIYARIYPALWIARQNNIPYLHRLEKFQVCCYPKDVLPESSGICDEMISLNFVLPRLVETANTKLLKDLIDRQLSNGSWYCCVVDLTALALITLQLTGEDLEAVKKGYKYIIRSENPDHGYPQFFPCEVFISTYVGFFNTYVCSRTDTSPPPWLTECREWILKKQNPTGSWSFTEEYPFGDIDDTAWAMLWLTRGCRLSPKSAPIKAGEKFILSSQNPDGGFPAWPSLESDTDVTAHALLTLSDLGIEISQQRKDNIFEYLANTQQENGSWIPRWHHSPIYGVTQVLMGIESYEDTQVYDKALQFLVDTQQDDGSWGTAEETGLALSTLLSLPNAPPCRDSIEKGISHLVSTQTEGGWWDYRDSWIAECSYSSGPLAITPQVAALRAYLKKFL